MIQITPHMKILICRQHVDFRKGIDGLAQVCRSRLDADPMTGVMFVFRNRLKTCVKVLVYDGQGFWLCQKRLSTGRYRWWPGENGNDSCELSHQELHVLLAAGNPDGASAPPDWRPLKNI